MPQPRKREDMRTRRDSPGDIQVKKGQAHGVQSWPLPDTNWCGPVVRMYESYKDSGMAAFFEQTDVSLVWIACEGLQAWYEGGKRSANQFEFVTGLLAKLGGSEAERRRMRIELANLDDEVSEEEASVVSIEKWKSKGEMFG